MTTTAAVGRTVSRLGDGRGDSRDKRSLGGRYNRRLRVYDTTISAKKQTDQKTDQTRQRACYTCLTRDGHVYCSNARTDEINVDTRKHEHIHAEKLRSPPKTHWLGAVQFDDGHRDEIDNAEPIKSSPS